MMAHLLDVRDLSVSFPSRRVGLVGRRPEPLRAVDGVSFTVDRGEVLALVGESGSGKTTTAHAALGLLKPSSGTVTFQDDDLGSASRTRLRRLRRQMQLVYQDPYESLNPRHSVGRIVEEPLRIHRIGRSRGEHRELVKRALELVGLSPADAYLSRMPHELSGGQRQRVSIAAALVLGADLLVADEPVSMLDVSVRAGILDLLDQLRGHGLGVLMITHDLLTAAHHADRIAVMYLGRIVEQGPARAVVGSPQHPYTRALLSVVPRPGRAGTKRVLLSGEIPDASAIPLGCRFHPRCPIAVAACRADVPVLLAPPGAATGHEVACLQSQPSADAHGGQAISGMHHPDT